MESRFRSIFLVAFMVVGLMSVTDLAAQSEEGNQGNLIEPQIERIEFDEAQIDTDDFELSVFSGLLSIEQFGTESVLGLKLAYHLSEDVFVQAAYGISNVGETSFEILSGGAPLLSSDERELEYYLISLGFKLMPGEAFITESTTFNTVFYLVGGLGTTRFAGKDRFTAVYGVGYRILFADEFSLDVEMRDLIFSMDIFGEDKITNNLDFSIALNFNF